jgi:hypothetical protein
MNRASEQFISSMPTGEFGERESAGPMLTVEQRNLHPNSKDTKEQLLERVQANMRTPRS